MTLQAQVEPQLLFDTLRDIRGNVDADPAGAEALLSDLVDLLRALLPQRPERTGHTQTAAARAALGLTSVQREIRVVQAYGRVRRQAGLLPPALTWQVAPEVAQVPVAPGLLLDALRSVLQAQRSPRRWLVCVAVDTREAGALWGLAELRCAPAVAADEGTPAPPQPLPPQVLNDLEARLQAVHGPQARVSAPLAADGSPAAGALAHGVVLTLQWPL
jgi:hypothetical protein